MENKESAAEGGQPEKLESPETAPEVTKTNDVDGKGPTNTDATEEEPTQNGGKIVENGEESDKPKEPSAESEVQEEIPAPEKPEEDKNEGKIEDKKEKPEDNTEDKVEEKPERTTRSRKRKATDSDKTESSNDVTSNETTEQKENLDLKSNDNMLKDSESKSTDDSDDPSIKSFSGTNVMGKGKRARIPNKRYSDILLSPNRKSGGLQKPFTTIAEPEISIKEEPVEAPVLPVITRVSSPVPGKKGRQSMSKENLQDPKYLKPFKFGWKRELVWRSTVSMGKRMGDIYYYTPAGKKVRSFREVSDHLSNKNLSLDNFSFTKEPLGIDDPEKEIIRDAKVPKSSDSFSESSVLPKKMDKLEKQEVKKPKKPVSPKSSGAESPKVATPVSTPVATTSGRRRAAAAGVASVVEKEKESTKKTPTTPKNVKETPTPTKKAVKMPLKKGKAPPAKKPKLAIKSEDSMEVDMSPPTRSTRASLNATPQSQPQPKAKKRNLKVKSITNSVNAEEKNETKFMENYLQNLSFGYSTLLYVFQYLKVQDLLRAGCVCTMWRDIASHPILWRTVRMKNSQVHSFEGLANTLKKHGTVHLDLRKMLLPSNGDEIWPEFSRTISRVDTLRKIELCRCPAPVVEQLVNSNPTLEVINAVTIKCESMDLNPFSSLRCIRELRLKSTLGLNVNSIDSLKELKTLKILSLTSVNELHSKNLDVIAELTNLEALDLGECSDFPKNFGQDILIKLEKLEKLRLEKGQGNCHTFEILNAVKDMKSLEQLELVNFDVKAGFDKAIGSCTNIKKLMIIPTYISQSATTNNMVLSGVLRLQGSLTHFVWGVTLELLRVTELFVDQCEDSNKKEKKPTGNGDSIPVLKPVPDLSNGGAIQAASNPPQVEILPLPNLQKLLLNSLPTTRVKILKIPFHATWRQFLTDSV